MSEWKPFDTAPKDGKLILAATKDDVFLIEMDQISREWHLSPGHIIKVVFTHWMEAPELPVKDHECFNGKMKYIRCYSDHGKLYLEMRDECKTYSVNYCPFCGEKA